MRKRLRRRLKPTEGSLKVVFNTSPLIILARLGVLEDSIANLFSEAQVPQGAETIFMVI